MKIGAKEKIQLVITAVLVLVLMAGIVNLAKQISERKSRSRKPQAPVRLFSEQDIEVAEEKTEPLYDRLHKATQKIHLPRDPFFRKRPTVLDEESFVLKGIAWDPQRPSAIINEDVVWPGDQIGSYSVITIEPYRVILSDGEEERILSIEVD